VQQLKMSAMKMSANDPKRIIFADLIDKLDVLYVHCPKCNRAGRFRIEHLVERQRWRFRSGIAAPAPRISIYMKF
jgi:hypothetical protein